MTAALPSACSPWVAQIKEDKADRPICDEVPRQGILCAENQLASVAGGLWDWVPTPRLCYVVYIVMSLVLG